MNYFCYEKNFADAWCPALYGKKPEAPKKGDRERSVVIEVEESMTLDACVAKYPPQAKVT